MFSSKFNQQQKSLIKEYTQRGFTIIVIDLEDNRKLYFRSLNLRELLAITTGITTFYDILFSTYIGDINEIADLPSGVAKNIITVLENDSIETFNSIDDVVKYFKNPEKNPIESAFINILSESVITQNDIMSAPIMDVLYRFAMLNSINKRRQPLNSQEQDENLENVLAMEATNKAEIEEAKKLLAEREKGRINR